MIDVSSSARVLKLVKEVADARGLAVLATVARSGGPRGRTVVLRQLVRRAVWLSTHAGSEKVQEVGERGDGELVLWLASERVQVRMRGRVRVVDAKARGELASVRRAAWKLHGPETREMFHWPAPGRVIGRGKISGRGDEGIPAAFAVLILQIQEMDVLAIARPMHRRALHVWRRGAWRVSEVTP